jgi:hypothetical protein
MKNKTRPFHFVVWPFALVICVSSLAAFSKVSSRAERMEELRAIASDIKSAILSQDVPRLLSYVNESIACIDSRIERTRVDQDLRDPKSDLYKKMFGPAGMKDYFLQARDQGIKISFIVVKGKEDLDLACIRYTSSSSENWPEVCLDFRNGKWGVTNSLYDCL